MIYVGDRDAEGVGKDESGCPFWGFAGKGVEIVSAVAEVLSETFPSALDGTAFSMIAANNSDCVASDSAARFSFVGG
jgi:hypothetical protein